LRHTGVFPDDNLILGIAMRGYDLVAVFRPGEIADLGARVDFLYALARGRIPKLDAAVCGATPRGEEGMLVRGPGDSFHCGGVVAEFPERGFGEFVPDHELIVIASRSELPVFSVPAQATNFLLVADKFAEELVGLANVAMVDEAVTGAGG